MSIVRTALTSLVVTLALSIEVKDRPIFDHIYRVISPATSSVQTQVEALASSGLRSIRRLTLDLFDNSVPRIRDTVKSQLSAVERSPLRKPKVDAEPLDEVSVEEKRELDRLILNP